MIFNVYLILNSRRRKQGTYELFLGPYMDLDICSQPTTKEKIDYLYSPISLPTTNFQWVRAKYSKYGKIRSYQYACTLLIAAAYSIFGIFWFDQLKIHSCIGCLQKSNFLQGPMNNLLDPYFLHTVVLWIPYSIFLIVMHIE